MDELEALEQRLRARVEQTDAAEQAAAEALRPRVLAAMRVARKRPATPLWVFSSGAAAAVILLANLALSTAQMRPLVAVDVVRTRAIAAELRGLVPELDEREALRQALLLEARSRTPDFGGQQIRSSAFVMSNRSGNGEIEP